MARQLFPEWRAEHEGTPYPFGDEAALVNAEGLSLAGIFLDAMFYPVGGAIGTYLASIVVDFNQVTLTVGDQVTKTRATASFPLVTPPALVRFMDSFQRPAGVLVSTAQLLGAFQSWPKGAHIFTPAQATFAATVCVPTPEIGVRGIVLDDGTVLNGDIWLVGEDGVVIREDHAVLDPATVTSPYHIVRVDVVGDPLFQRRLCTPNNLFVTPNFVKKIQVLAPNESFILTPDANGNILMSLNNALTEATMLRLHTVPQGIKIEVLGSAAD